MIINLLLLLQVELLTFFSNMSCSISRDNYIRRKKVSLSEFLVKSKHHELFMLPCEKGENFSLFEFLVRCSKCKKGIKKGVFGTTKMSLWYKYKSISLGKQYQDINMVKTNGKNPSQPKLKFT